MTPGLTELFQVFGRVGLLSFGGPAAQIALMHRELVEERPWLTERQFLNALSFCMLLPGPEAMQLATYSGWRLRGVTGGLIAGLLFVVPGAVVMLALASIYAGFGQVPLVAALFLGIKAAVVVIVIEALLKVARRALRTPDRWVIAGLSFLAIYAFAAPFPLIIAFAAAYGAVLGTGDPETDDPAPHAHRRTLLTVATWLVLWWTPIALLLLAGAEQLAAIGIFFAKLAVVTFGGAYAVLAYMTQAVVEEHGWLTTTQMMDGLGLAETTPGPLILVTQFVGYLSAFGMAGWPAAFAASVLTLWMTFVPCFLWIFAGAPYIEWISTRPRLTGALSAITAAVVGVILNLSLWFALHIFFGRVTRFEAFPFVMPVPVVSTVMPTAILLAAVAGLLLFRFRLGLPVMLAIMAGLGVAVSALV